VIFKYDGKSWQRIPLQELPTEVKTPNLIFSMPDIKVEESGKRFMSSEMIKAITAEYRQPEYKTILREPLRTESCPQYSSSPKAPIPVVPSTSTK
jgi:hypothetical protein